MFTTSKQLARYERAIKKRNRKYYIREFLEAILIGLGFGLVMAIGYLIGTDTFYLIFNYI